MKKRELKHLIKECVREVLFEESVLSSVIAEVAFGLTKAQQVMLENNTTKPTSTPPPTTQDDSEIRSAKLQETRKRMLEAIGKESMMGAFEGTEPLSSKGSVQESTHSAPGPLSHLSPHDPGVNIDSLFRSVGNSWQKLKG